MVYGQVRVTVRVGNRVMVRVSVSVSVKDIIRVRKILALRSC